MFSHLQHASVLPQHLSTCYFLLTGLSSMSHPCKGLTHIGSIELVRRLWFLWTNFLPKPVDMGSEWRWWKYTAIPDRWEQTASDFLLLFRIEWGRTLSRSIANSSYCFSKEPTPVTSAVVTAIIHCHYSDSSIFCMDHTDELMLMWNESMALQLSGDSGTDLCSYLGR